MSNNSRMKTVCLLVVGSESRVKEIEPFRIESTRPAASESESFDHVGKVLCVVAPIGDDWTTSVRVDLREFDAKIVSIEGFDFALEFLCESARVQFEEWLDYANARAAEGYRTMRG